MSPAAKELHKMVLNNELAHGNNPVLRWCADNVVVKIDPADNIKIDKSKTRERVDGVVALVMALGRGILSVKKPSVYATRGLTLI